MSRFCNNSNVKSRAKLYLYSIIIYIFWHPINIYYEDQPELTARNIGINSTKPITDTLLTPKNWVHGPIFHFLGAKQYDRRPTHWYHIKGPRKGYKKNGNYIHTTVFYKWNIIYLGSLNLPLISTYCPC